MKAQHASELAVGWQVMRFARTEKPKALAEYLKPEPTLAEKRAAGAARLIAKLERMSKKGNTDGAE